MFIFLVAVGGGGGGGGEESRPVDGGGGSCKKGPFMVTKWAQNHGVILVGLALDSVGYIRLAQ